MGSLSKMGCAEEYAWVFFFFWVFLWYHLIREEIFHDEGDGLGETVYFLFLFLFWV